MHLSLIRAREKKQDSSSDRSIIRRLTLLKKKKKILQGYKTLRFLRTLFSYIIFFLLSELSKPGWKTHRIYSRAYPRTILSHFSSLTCSLFSWGYSKDLGPDLRHTFLLLSLPHPRCRRFFYFFASVNQATDVLSFRYICTSYIYMHVQEKDRG